MLLYCNHRDYQWQYIVSLYNRDRQTEAGTFHKQILYMTVVLFVECLFNYVSSVDPELFAQGQCWRYMQCSYSLSSHLSRQHPCIHAQKSLISTCLDDHFPTNHKNSDWTKKYKICPKSSHPPAPPTKSSKPTRTRHKVICTELSRWIYNGCFLSLHSEWI